MDPRFESPAAAILLVGALGTLGVILGEGTIGPMVNVATICFGLAFSLVSLGVIRLRMTRPDAERPYKVPGGVFTAGAAVAASILFIVLAAMEPYEPGGGIPLEWMILAAGVLVGAGLWLAGSKPRSKVSDEERRRLILG